MPQKACFMSSDQSKTAIWLILMTVLALTACSGKPAPADKIAGQQLPTAVTTQRSSSALAALNVARSLIGTSYRYGGSDPRGFDCSGLVQYCFRQAGISLPRTSSDIFRLSQLVNPQDVQPGDLVFFAITPDKVSHVGIYADDGHFIHAPSSGKGVSYAKLTDPYWRKRLIGVGRL